MSSSPQTQQQTATSWSPVANQLSSRPFKATDQVEVDSSPNALQSRPFSNPATTVGAQPNVQARLEGEQQDNDELFDLTKINLFAGAGASAPPPPPVQRSEAPSDSTEDLEEEQEDKESQIQRKCDACATEDEDNNSGDGIQAKLTIGQPGDQYEQEADRTAAQVMAMPDPGLSTQNSNLKPQTSSPSLQSKGSAPQAPENFEGQLAQHKGSGQPLSDETRSFMEPRFGADFSGVRIHQAPKEAGAIGAQAFTHGQDIYFNSGKYNPGSSSGKELLAHELTHTIQQTGGNLKRKPNKVQFKLNRDSLTEDLQARTRIQRREAPPEQDAEQSTDASSAQTASEPTQNAEVSQANSPTAQTKEPQAEAPSASVAGGESSGATGAIAPPQSASSSSDNAQSSASTSDNQQAESSNATVTQTDAAADSSPSSADPHQAEAATTQAPQSPEDDPGFQAVVQNVGGVAATEQEHNPATDDASAAQAAARSPANEVESQAQNQQVGVMDQQEPGTFDAEAFKSALLSKIADIIPDTEEGAQGFGDNNELDSVRNDVSSDVATEQENAAGSIQDAAEAEPDTSQIEARTETPLAPQNLGTATTEVGAQQATPSPRSEAEITTPLNAGVQELDQQMADANVTEEQLANSGEPAFQFALGARNEVATDAANAPGTYRQQEQGILTQAQANAQATSQQQLTAMHGDRETLLNQVAGGQTQTQTQDEGERTTVAREINGIYGQTKTDVDNILSGLDDKVSTKFDTAANRAKSIFESYVKQKMDAWEDKRYGEFYDVTGWDERLSDAWNGLPEEVNKFFVDGKQKYIDEMDKALTDIANLVATTLDTAKQRIAQGRQEIQNYVAQLPESLKQYGEEAAQSIQQKFDELDSTVNSKQDELIDSLAQRYRDSLQEINARIEEMQEANRGLKDKAADALGGAIQTILELKDMLMGVLARAAGAVEQIILDPIEFLGNLIDGVQQGFQNFVANIWEHLKKGLIGWLTGALAGAGIQIPETFDLKGIFTLVMQVLGVAYESIKARAIQALGPKGAAIFEALETAFEIFVILKDEGIAGLWQFIQEKIGDLKVMVLDTIQNFVVETVIKQGVLWVISLLNPASAFVKACKMIYDVVIFFVERGSQIVDLVNAVVDSVGAIASGAVGGAAKLIEGALAKALPVVISFMASLLGLGGISEKIREIIDVVKAPIDKAIDWLIEQAVKFAKKMGKVLGFGSDVEGEDGEQTTEGEGGDLEDSEVGKTINFNAGNESHRLWISTQGSTPEVMVASSPTSVEAKLDEWQGRLDSLSDEDRPRAQSLIATARQQLSTTEQSAQQTAQEMQEAQQDSANETAINEAESADNQTEAVEQSLSTTVQQLFEFLDSNESLQEGELLRIPFNMAGSNHHLYVEHINDSIEVSMASRKDKVIAKYEAVKNTIENYRNSPEMSIPGVKEEFDELYEPEISSLIAAQIIEYTKEIEGLNSKQTSEVLERCRASAQALIAQLIAWGESHNISDLSPEAVRHRLEEETKQRRQHIIQEVQNRLGIFVADVKGFDPSATLEFRGSLATGRKHSGEPFNPNDFDVDAFIKSDLLWDKAINDYDATPQEGKIWADSSGIPGLPQLQQKMFDALESIAGMRREFSLVIRSEGIVKSLRRRPGEKHIRIPEVERNKSSH